MWGILAITLHLFSGPDGYGVAEAGLFETEEACEAALKEAVPAKIGKKEHRELYEAGQMKYICIKVIE